MHRFLRIAGSFVIVLVAYLAYALVAVPLIESSAAPRPPTAATYSHQGRRLTDARIEALRPLFPPGAWEVGTPKILESDQAKLLIGDYRNRGDGRVEIQPCTMIFLPGKPDADEARRLRQAIVLQAPEGALLEFDRAFDLRRADIGRLVGGHLKGRITIFSRGTQPGADDLSIVTEDVKLTENEVTTPHPVDFRWGRNCGRGQQMRIKLLPGPQRGRNAGRGPSIGGVELFELRHVERLHLELAQVKPASPNMPDRMLAAGRTGLGLAANQDLPVEITCCGPFRFDPIGRVATFEDRVDVWRINPSGPSDQLSCQLLSIFFTDRAAAPAGGPPQAGNDSRKQPGGSLNLTPERIEARGDPVVVAAPSQQLNARAQRLDYDLQTNQIALEGTQEVLLQQGLNEIRSRGLRYQAAEPGRLGRATAQGPGWLRGQLADRPDQEIEARWGDLLQIQPEGQNQVISLTGGAEMKFRGIGQLSAQEIHFWMLESPPGDQPNQPRLRPDRMLARQQVRVDSPQFSSNVQQLEMWFEPADTASGERWPATQQPAPLQPTAYYQKLPLLLREGRGNIPPLPLGEGRGGGAPERHNSLGHETGAANALTLTLSRRERGLTALSQRERRPAALSGTNPPQHFEILGRLLRARILIAENQQSELAELLVEDGARLVETQTAQPDERPLLVSGERLHVVDAAKPHAAVVVTGPQAHFEGRGLALTGPNINLNRGTNQLWIDGPGHMELPLDRDLEGRPLSNPAVLQVDWQQRMTFDGRTARFEASVTAATPLQNLRTETLEVELQQAINFADRAIRQDPQVQQIDCHGGVVMENRSFDQHGQTAQDRIEVVHLAVNLQSGALTAGGPGRINSVRYAADDALMAGGVGGPAATPLRADRVGNAAAAERQDDQLKCLHIRFQGSINGNFRHRELTFADQVKTIYGPVNSWMDMLTTDDPQALGPHGVVLRCDKLTVRDRDTATRQDNRRALELEAVGNIIAESTTYTARAARMTYAEAKDLLRLEGDGHSDAELFRQTQIGAAPSPLVARTISYRPKAKTISVGGAQSLEINQFPMGKGGK